MTRRDLKFLKHEVWRAIQDGMIQSQDGMNAFDPSDQVRLGCELCCFLSTPCLFHPFSLRIGIPQGATKREGTALRYGPSIYSVNEQYIKPVTRDAGLMSWALMRNPEGLDCDLFISHAWQEGIFEFLTKVKHSWPRRVRNAWCCMLANPQNLDIGALLQTPSDSPFALALRASKIVLVVPNRHESVYTRLWCGYEAYLAEEEGKTIVIAKDSKLHDIRHLGCAFSAAYFLKLKDQP